MVKKIKVKKVKSKKINPFINKLSEAHLQSALFCFELLFQALEKFIKPETVISLKEHIKAIYALKLRDEMVKQGLIKEKKNGETKRN